MKVERSLLTLATQKQRTNCNCRITTFADESNPDEFEAEMDRFCWAHFPRQLGIIVRVRHIGSDSPNRAKLDELLKIYRARQSPAQRRLLQVRQAGLRLKNVSEER